MPFRPACTLLSGVSSRVTTGSIKMQSSTLRANTPVVSRVWETGATPLRGQRPVVGLNPMTPQSDAGTRIDPIVSPPKDAGTRQAGRQVAAGRNGRGLGGGCVEVGSADMRLSTGQLLRAQ